MTEVKFQYKKVDGFGWGYMSLTPVKGDIIAGLGYKTKKAAVEGSIKHTKRKRQSINGKK